MDLTLKPITRKSPDYKQFIDILVNAFPHDELIPTWLLNLAAKRKAAKYLGIYAGDTPIAVMFTLESSEMVYLLYIAVREDLRNKGYGSEIVKLLLKHAGGRELALNSEYPGENAPDDDIRKRRLRFYDRLGIRQSGWGCTTVGVTYAVLTSHDELNAEALYKTVASLFFGLYKVEGFPIKKVEL